MLGSTGRQVGVTIPEGQLNQDRGTPNTVSHAVECTMVASRYFDEFGRAHDVVLLKVGSALYYPPNAEAWAAALREATPWLTSSILAHLSIKTADVPKSDTVDVVASSMARDMQP